MNFEGRKGYLPSDDRWGLQWDPVLQIWTKPSENTIYCPSNDDCMDDNLDMEG